LTKRTAAGLQHRKPTMKPITCVGRMVLLSLLYFLVPLGDEGALAQERIVEHGPYVGKLAGRDVVARFMSDAQGLPMPGSFFYRDTGKDIVLFHDPAQGRFMECAPTWQEEETVQGCSEPSGYWTVQLTPNAALVDWQTRPDDQPLRTVLTRSAPVPGAVDLDAQIGALRVAGPRLAGPEQGHGAVRWHMVTEPRSKVSMPFLTRAPALAAMRRINASLEQQFQGQIGYVLFDIARHNGEANFDNKAFVTGTKYFAIAEGVGSYSDGGNGGFTFSAATFDLKSGQPVEFARHYHIHPFERTGKKTAGLSLMEQARAQHQTASFSDQKRSYWGEGIECWGKGADSDSDSATDTPNEFDPGGMTYAAEQPSGELTQWTVFPTADGLAIAYNGFAEYMRPCRADYRVIPWPQAALARRLPKEAGNQAAPKAPASQSGARCPR
jgi:hypothetical protein